jgi:uncharacterized protein (TIGR02266 family)
MRAMAASDRERRSHFRGKPRPGRRVEVEYALPVDDGKPPRRAFTRNIGVGGAFIVTESPPPPGTPVALTLLVPTGGGRVAVAAEVRWIVSEGAQPGMGVRFIDLEVDELLELNEYFATLTGDDE